MRINWYSFSDHLRDNLVLQINNCYCITMIQILLLDMAMVFTGTHMKIVINVNHKWEPKKSAFISPFLGHFQICPMRFHGHWGRVSIIYGICKESTCIYLLSYVIFQSELATKIEYTGHNQCQHQIWGQQSKHWNPPLALLLLKQYDIEGISYIPVAFSHIYRFLVILGQW